MKAFIVYCHPSENSFTRHVRDSFIKGIEDSGNEYVLSDLYKMNFKTDMSEHEYLRDANYKNTPDLAEDVLAEQKKINSSDAIVFIYPVFWTEAPAKLVGWFDRVWSHGFAYGENRTMKVLDKALFLVTAGNTMERLEKFGLLDSMKKVMIGDRIFDRAKKSDFVIFPGMSRKLASREEGWGKNLKTAYEKGRNLLAYKEADMKNPWEEISLSDYENHMKHGSVMQLQTLNSMTKEQLESYSVKTAMIFGIAGGNGLDHVKNGMFEKLYGVDINANYLNEVQKRHANLGGMLECLHLDLTTESEKLPSADFVIANLLVEYIGYSAFKNAVERANPKYVSCIIQINDDTEKWVSSSPYIHAFDNLGKVHNQMAESELNAAMEEIGYKLSSQKSVTVPGGKKLVRLDYSRRI